MSRVPLLAGLLWLVGCGLIPTDPVGFRTYTLKDVDYAAAEAIVLASVRDTAASLWGGVAMTWDAESRNLTVDPVYDGSRRLRLYIHLEPTGGDVEVEMLALVDQMESTGAGISYGPAKQDVPLEEGLFNLFVGELLELREAGS